MKGEDKNWFVSLLATFQKKMEGRIEGEKLARREDIKRLEHKIEHLKQSQPNKININRMTQQEAEREMIKHFRSMFRRP